MTLGMGRVLVFGTSAAVLTLEILAGRIMAPYVGVTLETFTGIIGVVLAGIAIGAWWGGRAADRSDPTRLLAPLMLGGGTFVLAAPVIVDAVGPSLRSGGPIEIVFLTAVGFFVPSAVLSAVPPVVVKLRLASLDETGTVVGSFSALGTLGALVGTFLTGFVLLAAAPTRPLVFGLGVIVIVTGIWLAIRQRTPGIALVWVIGGVAAGGLLLAAGGPCERETAYFCVSVNTDPARPSGRFLQLDTLNHSYVDIADPSYLHFRYAKVVGDVLDSLDDGPLDVAYIGGGGFTLPAYVDAVRPGSTADVFEIDPGLIDVAEEQLGLEPADWLSVEIGDARLRLPRRPAGAYDVVVGDAFGGLSVPWHLTTREFLEDVRTLLQPDGLYVINLLDYPPLGFAKAEAATIADVFPHAAVFAPTDYLDGSRGGNFVIVGARSPRDWAALEATITMRGGAELAVTGDRLDEWFSGSEVLVDDFAPVDQLINGP